MGTLIRPPKAARGDKVAVVSPSYAAPAVAPAVHEQGLRRLTEATGLVPVEYPTTRRLNASARDRAADLNDAFADPEIRAVLTTTGGSDQITVVPHLDAELVRADPKPFLGFSDNTNILNWLWTSGVAGFYGGSTQLHLGSGPHIDAEHLASLKAALLGGDDLVLTDPVESEDFGWDFEDPRALHEFGHREPTEPWTWAGPAATVRGPTWGGCLDVIEWIALAGRMPATEELDGAILLFETSELVPSADRVRYWVRSLGERGVLEAARGIILARPPTSGPGTPRPPAQHHASWRAAQRDAVIEQVSCYNPDAVICVGPPFGHTRPQWIVPFGGSVTLDGAERTIVASYR